MPSALRDVCHVFANGVANAIADRTLAKPNSSANTITEPFSNIVANTATKPYHFTLVKPNYFTFRNPIIFALHKPDNGPDARTVNKSQSHPNDLAHHVHIAH